MWYEGKRYCCYGDRSELNGRDRCAIKGIAKRTTCSWVFSRLRQYTGFEYASRNRNATVTYILWTAPFVMSNISAYIEIQNAKIIYMFLILPLAEFTKSCRTKSERNLLHLDLKVILGCPVKESLLIMDFHSSGLIILNQPRVALELCISWY